MIVLCRDRDTTPPEGIPDATVVVLDELDADDLIQRILDADVVLVW